MVMIDSGDGNEIRRVAWLLFGQILYALLRRVLTGTRHHMPFYTSMMYDNESLITAHGVWFSLDNTLTAVL